MLQCGKNKPNMKRVDCVIIYYWNDTIPESTKIKNIDSAFACKTIHFSELKAIKENFFVMINGFRMRVKENKLHNMVFFGAES